MQFNRFNILFYLYLLVIGIFLIIISPNLLSEGMFVDGVTYASISNHLAHGIGNFWNPYYTKILYANFHQHPPLFFGIQSLFYYILGDGLWVEKIYSLFNFIIVGYIIHLIWKKIKSSNSWLPLLLWTSIPLVYWACTNNMLENTLSIFITLSVLFYLKSNQKYSTLYIFLSGLMLALGFLTKGFVAFFPWTLPFVWWLVFRTQSFKIIILQTIGIIGFTIIPLIILLVLNPDAKDSLYQYINEQVVNSIKNIATVESRFYIVGRLFSELIPAIIIVILLYLTNRKIKINNQNIKHSFVFFIVGLTGVLPIMVSMKQSGFYMLATLPFFAISLALFISEHAQNIVEQIQSNSKYYNLIKITSIGIISVGIVSSIYFSNKISRDKELLTDLKVILKYIPQGSIINIPRSQKDDWSLHAYFSRMQNISLEDSQNPTREYLVIDQNKFKENSLLKNYKIIEIPTTQFLLYQRK